MSLTEEEVIANLQAYFEGLFPKTCSNCGRKFETLEEYILVSHRLGRSISYDAELGDWDTRRPIGSAALSNCPCGTTLALTTEQMPMDQRLALLAWVKEETERRNISPSELLDYLRDHIRARVIAGSHAG